MNIPILFNNITGYLSSKLKVKWETESIVFEEESPKMKRVTKLRAVLVYEKTSIPS